MRAVGPALRAFGLSSVCENPTLELWDPLQVRAANDDWGAQPGSGEVVAASMRSGAFALDVASADAALVRDLAPGSYSVIVTDAARRGGEVLVEVYAVDE